MTTVEYSKWMIIGDQILIESHNIKMVSISNGNSVIVTTNDGNTQITKPFASVDDALECLRQTQHALSLIELEGKR